MGYPAHNYMTPEQIEAQRRAIERAKKESHDEALKGHEKEMADYRKANEDFPLQTNFTAHDLDTLKGMIEHANPDGVDTIGKNWKKVHDRLVGAGGGSPSGDSAYGQLKKAVDNVLEHWEGESANQFKVKAQDILQQIANSAAHAQNVSEVMSNAANDLRTQRDAISKIEKPNWLESAWDRITDSGRDEKYTREDIKSGNVPKDLIAEANEGYIGEEKEAQLKAASIMETLGRSYVGYSRRIRAPRDDKEGGVPPSNPDTPMPTPIPATSGSASVPASRRAATSKNLTGTVTAPEATGPRDPGISGGQQVPAAQTKVDSLPSGISGGGGAAGGGAVSGAASGGVGSTGGAGATAGATGGGLIAGGAAAAGGARGAAGRPGIGGAGALGGRGAGGAAAGGRGGAGAAGRGALAKTKGGVVGAPKGISGGKPATPGGTGLGRGRTGPSGTVGRGGAGMVGGARGTSQRPDEEERDQGKRPDYLVEDEETWTPEDNRSVPKTID